MPSQSINKDEYIRWLGEMKSRIRSARSSAARAVNNEIILLYWDIGCGIVQNQETLGWGKSVVDRLSSDLQKEFPGTTGFSARNLWDMRRLFESYSDPDFVAQAESILRQAVAELTRRGASKPSGIPVKSTRLTMNREINVESISTSQR